MAKSNKNTLKSLKRNIGKLQSGIKYNIGKYVYWIQHTPQEPDGNYNYGIYNIYRTDATTMDRVIGEYYCNNSDIDMA